MPRKRWTQAEIVEKIQLWAATYGEPPSYADWTPFALRTPGAATRADERIARFEAGEWPLGPAVAYRFGKWSRAIEAAGFTPHTGARRWPK